MGSRMSRRVYEMPYVDGTAARKLAPVPEYDRERSRRGEWEEENRRGHKEKPVRKPQVGHGIDFLSMALLVGAIILTLYVCIEYLQVQAEITQTEMEISKLSTELATLTAANNAFEESLDAQIDWDYVYETAVGRLGMVYPNKNTVITYQREESGYVRHYKDIPE